MRARDVLRLAGSAVAAHRLRTALTVLGIAIGVAAVVLLTSIGEGARQFILGEFTQFGTNLLAINPGKTATTGQPGALGGTIRKLTIEDVQAIERVVDVTRVVPVAMGTARVEARGRGRSVFVYGVTDAVPDVWKFGVRQGRFLPAGDPRRSAPLAVLGPKLKREIFGDANALGAYVRIGGRRFKVIGVMEPKGRLLGLDIDDSAYVPVASAQDLFNRDDLMEIDVNFRTTADERDVVRRIRSLLIERHDGEDDFTITTQTEMLDVLGRVLGIVRLAVGGIGAVSLLVGAVGILTMMWISVGERTAEIGLARALGATPRQIRTLFLAEASILSGAGGIVGIAAGLGLAAVLRIAVPGMPVHTPAVYVVAAIAVAVAVGLGSGVLPARRAARLDPVEALHAE